jgi:pilus assembly protein CpaB
MRRPTIFLMLAVVAAFSAAVVVFSALKSREAQIRNARAQSVNLVVAARYIPIGSKIEPDAVKLARWSRESEPEGAVADPAAVVGSYAKSSFVGGEPIVRKKLFNAEETSGVMPLIIPPGMRAMSVPVDEVSDIAGFIQPHTRVDVLVAISGGGPDEKPFSKIVLQDVEVLAIAQQVEQAGDKPQVVKVVTLLVTPHEAEKLGLASREGTLRLAMRNYADNRRVATPGSDIADLLGWTDSRLGLNSQVATVARRAPRVHGAPAFSIEIMRDGKSSETVSFVSGAMAPKASPAGRTEAPSSANRAPEKMPARADRPMAPVARGAKYSSASQASYLPAANTINPSEGSVK